MRLRPIQDRTGAFLGFSALVAGEWTPPQPYKAVMLALRDAGADPIYIPPPPTQEPRHSGYGVL